MKAIRSLGLLCSWIFAGCFFASSAIAAPTILVSGDSNIGNALDGSLGAPINEDNGTWFANILGNGTEVRIQSGVSGGNVGPSVDAINDHYNSLDGVTSSLLPADANVDDTLLARVDLFISVLPSDNYTAAELTSLSSLLSGGGSLFFVGEYDGWATWNSRINAALVSLGSSISIVNDRLDSGWVTTSNIELDLFNAGVADFTYNTISVTSGGEPLIRSLDGTTFIAYETVPVPAAVWLFGSGLVVLFGMARRRSRAISNKWQAAFCGTPRGLATL